MYEVRKHFKDSEGFIDYECLFKSNSEQEAINFRAQLPKDTKKIQYSVNEYRTVKVNIAEADRIHKQIWQDKISDKVPF